MNSAHNSPSDRTAGGGRPGDGQVPWPLPWALQVPQTLRTHLVAWVQSSVTRMPRGCGRQWVQGPCQCPHWEHPRNLGKHSQLLKCQVNIGSCQGGWLLPHQVWSCHVVRGALWKKEDPPLFTPIMWAKPPGAHGLAPSIWTRPPRTYGFTPNMWTRLPSAVSSGTMGSWSLILM